MESGVQGEEENVQRLRKEEVVRRNGEGEIARERLERKKAKEARKLELWPENNAN